MQTAVILSALVAFVTAGIVPVHPEGLALANQDELATGNPEGACWQVKRFEAGKLPTEAESKVNFTITDYYKTRCGEEVQDIVCSHQSLGTCVGSPTFVNLTNGVCDNGGRGDHWSFNLTMYGTTNIAGRLPTSVLLSVKHVNNSHVDTMKYFVNGFDFNLTTEADTKISPQRLVGVKYVGATDFMMPGSYQQSAMACPARECDHP